MEILDPKSKLLLVFLHNIRQVQFDCYLILSGMFDSYFCYFSYSLKYQDPALSLSLHECSNWSVHQQALKFNACESAALIHRYLCH